MNTTDILIRATAAVALYAFARFVVASGDSSRLSRMARSARARARRAYAASAGFLPAEFFRFGIRGAEGVGRTVGARPLKCYRKEYPTMT
jgi:hypothetical protein